MESFIGRIAKQPLGAKIVLLTLYLILVNSYALFVVYPALKSSDGMLIGTSLLIYIVITVPLLAYIWNRYRPQPNKFVIAGGLILMAIALVVQYFMSHTSIPVLLLHALFYLFAGIVEETLWRGKLWQFVSQKVTSQWAVLVIVTAHFVALHIPFAILDKPSALSFLGQVLALGIALGVLRIVTKKVTVPALAHAVINMVVYT